MMRISVAIALIKGIEADLVADLKNGETLEDRFPSILELIDALENEIISE
jgi:hypothetical protein